VSRRHFDTERRPLFVPRGGRDYAAAQVFEAVFTERQCDRVVELGRALGAEEARVGSSEAEYAADEATRLAATAWIGVDDDTMWIFDKLARVAERANGVYGFDLTGFTEDIQFTRYETRGAFYGWHQDGLEGDVAVRKLSLVAQLSDPRDYDGAELELFAIGEEWDRRSAADFARRARQQGSVVAFPAFEFHRVTPLRRGRRDSLVSWIGGPPFR